MFFIYTTRYAFLKTIFEIYIKVKIKLKLKKKTGIVLKHRAYVTGRTKKVNNHLKWERH